MQVSVKLLKTAVERSLKRWTMEESRSDLRSQSI